MSCKVWQNGINHLLSDNRRQKIMQYRPLVMPTNHLLYFAEGYIFLTFSHHGIGHPIVEAQDIGLYLRYDHILIVPRVADNGPLWFAITGVISLQPTRALIIIVSS